MEVIEGWEKGISMKAQRSSAMFLLSVCGKKIVKFVGDAECES